MMVGGGEPRPGEERQAKYSTSAIYSTPYCALICKAPYHTLQTLAVVTNEGAKSEALHRSLTLPTNAYVYNTVHYIT